MLSNILCSCFCPLSHFRSTVFAALGRSDKVLQLSHSVRGFGLRSAEVYFRHLANKKLCRIIKSSLFLGGFFSIEEPSKFLDRRFSPLRNQELFKEPCKDRIIQR